MKVEHLYNQSSRIAFQEKEMPKYYSGGLYIKTYAYRLRVTLLEKGQPLSYITLAFYRNGTNQLTKLTETGKDGTVTVLLDEGVYEIEMYSYGVVGAKVVDLRNDIEESLEAHLLQEKTLTRVWTEIGVLAVIIISLIVHLRKLKYSPQPSSVKGDVL